MATAVQQRTNRDKWGGGYSYWANSKKRHSKDENVIFCNGCIFWKEQRRTGNLFVGICINENNDLLNHLSGTTKDCACEIGKTAVCIGEALLEINKTLKWDKLK